jgi:hypothetical protein
VKKLPVILRLSLAVAVALAASAGDVMAQSPPPAAPRAGDDPAGDADFAFIRSRVPRGSSDPPGPAGPADPAAGGAAPGDPASGGDGPSEPGARGDSSPEGDPEKLPLPHK